MTMADRFVLWRLMMKELARQFGWEATFMAKPYADRTGNGAHFNMSMRDLQSGKNLFGMRATSAAAASQKRRISSRGVLRHAAAIVATTCPTSIPTSGSSRPAR